jgi:predicted unusual protein kinase regulating ubiquinone biosynthesis (AarF/ABC1/UbiB family)
MTSARAALSQGETWVRTLRGHDDDEKARRQLDQAIRSAQQVAELMGEMKGAFMKVGQLLSFADTSMLPPEIRKVLATLQADAPPMAYELVAEVIEAELGAPPHKAFDWFSPAPMASASIGQVHAARLGDDEVVVKVQYPGVARAVAADLNNAGLMAAAMSVVQPFVRSYMGRLDVRALADEIRDRVLEELDYVGEAANQRLFAELFRDHPFIRIPEIVDDRSTSRILTSAYHDGMRWAAAVAPDQPQELKDRWGEVIDRFVFGSIYRHGVVNADPHPGNYLFHEDGTVTFVDFGCVKRLRPPVLATMIEIGRAVLHEDVDRFAEAVVAAGFLPGADTVAPDRLWAATRASYLPILEPQPWTYRPESVWDVIDTNIGLSTEYRTIARHVDVPPDYAFIGRIAIGAHSIMSGLRATGMWRSIAEELWLDAEPVTELGRLEQHWRARNTLDTSAS